MANRTPNVLKTLVCSCAVVALAGLAGCQCGCNSSDTDSAETETETSRIEIAPNVRAIALVDSKRDIRLALGH